MGDITTDGQMIAKNGVESTENVVAKKKVISQETETQTLNVKTHGKVAGKLDVTGHATMGSATIKGKLYVGDKAIGDLMESYEAEMSKARAEMAEMRSQMSQLMSALKLSK